MSVKRSTTRAAGKASRPRSKGRGEGTDWARLRAMTDEEARKGARGDADNPPAPAHWLEAGQLIEPLRKRAISLRLDPDVIDWFRGTGPKYQSRMNAVLRAFVEHRRRGADASSKAKVSARARER